jgi:hypothetical protein
MSPQIPRHLVAQRGNWVPLTSAQTQEVRSVRYDVEHSNATCNRMTDRGKGRGYLACDATGPALVSPSSLGPFNGET